MSDSSYRRTNDGSPLEVEASTAGASGHRDHEKWHGMTFGELSALASNLGAVEDWLRDSCTARHHEDMADLVGKAVGILEDLYDELAD